MVEHNPISTRDLSRLHQFWDETVAWYLSWVWIDRRRNLERRYSDCELGRFGKDGCIRHVSSKNQRERSIDTHKGDEINIPRSRWYSKIVKTTNSENPLQGGRIGRVSTDRIYRWRWSPGRLLVDPRWHHLSSSQWTSSSTPCAEGSNIPNSTKIHWCNKVYSHRSGRHARDTCRWLLECRFEQKLVRFVERFHEVYSVERKPPNGFLWSGWEDWQKFKRLPDQILYGQKYGPKLVKPLRLDKNKNGKTGSPNSTMLEDWEEVTALILMTKITEKLSNMRGKSWKRPMAAAMPCKRMIHTSTTKVAAKQEIASQKIPKTIYGWKVESHESTRQRVESALHAKHEDRIAGKAFTSMIHYNLVHKFIPMPQAMKIPDAKAVVDKEWKEAPDSFQHGNWKNQE